MTHPAIRDLFQSLGRHPAFQEAVGELLRAPSAQLSFSGLTATAKALYLVLLWQVTERPTIIVTDGNSEAETLTALTTTFFDLLVSAREIPRPQLLPALDVLPHQRLSPHSEIVAQRVVALWRLSTGRSTITITPIASALLRTEAADFYRQLALNIKVGDEVPLETVLQHLESIGYEKREPVEMVGEYSLRGGILDIFPAEADKPVRIELFGDLIESIRRFDAETQRSVLRTNEVLVLPLLEYPKSARLFRELSEVVDTPSPGDAFAGWEFAVPLVHPREATLLSLVRNAIVVLDEPDQIAAAADRLWSRLDNPDRAVFVRPDRLFLTWDQFRPLTERFGRVSLRQLDLASPGEGGRHIPTRPSMSFGGNIPVAVAEARTLVEQGNRVVVFAPTSGELERLADIFQEYSVPFQLGIDPSDAGRGYLAEHSYMAGSVASTFLVKGQVARGTVFTDARVAVFGSEDLFGSSDLVARPGTSKSQPRRFHGRHCRPEARRLRGACHARRRPVSGDSRGRPGRAEGRFHAARIRRRIEAVCPAHAHGSGAEVSRRGRSRRRALDRLGGATWQRTKSRVKAKMRDMADELLKLYAERRMAEGFAFSADSQLAARVRGRLRVHRDQRPARCGEADQARHGRRDIRWTACSAATWASAKPKSPCAPRSRLSGTANRWPCWRPPRSSRSSTMKRFAAALLHSPCASKCSRASCRRRS